MGLKKYWCGTIVFLLLLSCSCTTKSNVYECEDYSFSYPENVSIQAKEYVDYTEIDFCLKEKKIGGINYYPLSNWDDFYERGPHESNVSLFLSEQGILSSDETLDAYMLEVGYHTRSANLWERRSGIDRDHFFFFTESGTCYDLWLYSDSLEDSEKNTITESFRLVDVYCLEYTRRVCNQC